LCVWPGGTLRKARKDPLRFGEPVVFVAKGRDGHMHLLRAV